MNELRTYLAYEYVADYKAGQLARRDLVRRVLNVTGGLGSTATLLLALGCSTASPSSTLTGGQAPTPATAAAGAGVTAATGAAAGGPSAAGGALTGATPSAAAGGPSAGGGALAGASPPAATGGAAAGVASAVTGGGGAVGASPSPLAARAAASPAASSSGGGAGSPTAVLVAHSPLSVAANDPTIDGQDITFRGGDGATILAYQARLVANAAVALPLVLVCHENRGLTEHIRDVVRRFAKEGYIACGVDLVSRQGGTASITDPNQFAALLGGPQSNPDQFVADFASGVAYYTTRPDLVQLTKIGMNGYCFGGGVVWRATEQIAELKAAVPFYGAFPPPEKWSTIKAAILGVYSSDPNDFANARRDELDQALTAANDVHRFKVYPGTMHAFHNDTGPAYNENQALAAWRDMIAWFKQYLA